MRRYGYIVLLVALVAWIAVAVKLGTGGGSSSASSTIPPSGPSPACLSQSLDRSAALAGTTVDVSPAPDSDTANPHTQISFLGINVTNIRDVSVEGSQTGYHYGHLYGYFQGDGGSFVPYKPFANGEQVEVRATVGPQGSERHTSFSFRVATPYPTTGIPGFPDPAASPAAYQSFASAPDLHPPILTVTAPDLDPAAGEVMMTSGPGPGQYGPLIYSPQGRLVWFGAQPAGTNALNLSMQRYEGQNDLTWWRGHVISIGFGQGEDVIMDPNYQTVATVRAGNGYEADLHDFQVAPGNVAYISVYNVMRCDLSSLGGVRNGVIIDTAVQQVDIKTGLVRWEWHSLDHASVSESHAPVPTTAIPWDFFHLNSFDVQPNGNVLISARSTWAAYELQAGTGTIAWRLGGTNSSFTMGPGTSTAWQHDARLLPDGTVTTFDDGSNPQIHYQSRGVRVALDTTRHAARLIAAYPHPGGALLSDSQGNMQTLPDGNLVVGWGSIPSITEVAPNGRLLLDAHLPAGYSSYRAFRFPWTGHPLTSPAVSARELVTGDSVAVAASWNGAAEVASWRVLAGPSEGALTAQVTMPDSGFESTVTFPSEHPYVAVQALGSAGQLLGTSATVRVAGK
jgi:hypothetical protein